MDNHVDTPCNFLGNIVLHGMAAGAVRQCSHPSQSRFGAVGVDGRKRAAMACVQGIEQCPCFQATDLAQDDSVGPMAKGCLEKTVESDGILMRVKLGFGGDNMGLAKVQFRRVFDGQDTFLFRDGIGQNIENRGFSGTGSAADEQVIAATDVLAQRSGKFLGEGPMRDEILRCIGPCRELADGEQWTRMDDWRNQRSHAAAVRQAKIHDR